VNDLVIKLAILKYAQGRATIRFRIARYILVDICVADQLNSTQLNLYYSNCQTAVTVIYNIPKTPKYVKYMHFFGSPEAVSCDTGKYYLNSGDDPKPSVFVTYTFIHSYTQHWHSISARLSVRPVVFVETSKPIVDCFATAPSRQLARS